jgi:murein DD-endopeptidase MepM/ murein hydrolase activator NlpD
MTMLPDIDQASYDDYEKQRLQRELDQKLQSMTLQHALDSRIAEIGAVATPSDALTNPLGMGNAPPPPEPAPLPEPPAPVAQPVAEPDVFAAPAPPPAPPDAAIPSPGAAPAPFSAPAPSPTPTPAPTSGVPDLSDWIQSSAGAVARAGGDVKAYINNLSTSGDLISNAMGAAAQSGADMRAFGSSLPPPPEPAPAPPDVGAQGVVHAPAAPAGSTPADQPLTGAPNAAGQIYPLASKSSNAANATYHSAGGSDLMAPRGTPVLNMMDGTVSEVYTDKGDHQAGGNAVLIRGADGLDYYYAHFDGAPALKPGDRVVTGQQIGAVGNSGNAWKGGQGDTHLHIGIGHGISNGVGAEGGLGMKYDAQSVLNELAGGVGKGGPATLPSAATPTTAGISGGGDLSGRVGQGGQAILSGAADAASWLGDQGQKALQAILITEGGLGGARGDQGKSAGPLQFYEGGQLANFARTMGLSLDQAKTYVEQHPVEAVAWAVGTPNNPGYLGQAIAKGQAMGLSGPDLATYAQRTGQVSVSPERAGANFNSLFGAGQAVASSAGSAIGNAFSGLGQAKDSVVSKFTEPPPPPLYETSGKLTSAATGIPDDYAMRTASVGQPTSIDLPSLTTPAPTNPVDRLKSAFGDFVDSLTKQPAGQPAQSQALPSDTLTNPLGTGNGLQDTAVLTGQPAGGVAESTRPGQSALERVQNLQTVPEMLSPDWLAAHPEVVADVSQAVSNVSRNVPIVGALPEGVYEPATRLLAPLARGPELLSDEELLRGPDAVQARTILAQTGLDNPTDQEVADLARTLARAQAVAGTHGPNEYPRYAPRSVEGRAVPASGEAVLSDALHDLERYPPEIVSRVRDFVGSVEAPPSTLGSLVKQWMEQNPIATSPVARSREAAAEAAETVVQDLENGLKGRRMTGQPRYPEAGQLGFESELPYSPKPGGSEYVPGGAQPENLPLFGEEVMPQELQPRLPRTEGGEFNPENFVGTRSERQAELDRWQAEAARRQAERDANLAAARERQANLPPEQRIGGEPGDAFTQRTMQGEGANEVFPTEATQRGLRESGGEFQRPTGPATPEGFYPPELNLPKRVPENVRPLIEEANQHGDHRSPVNLEQLAEQGGTTVERLQKVWKPDTTPESTPTLRAIGKALDNSAAEVDRLQKILAEDPEDKDKIAAVIKQITRHQALQEVLEARPPEAAQVLKRINPNTLPAHEATMTQLNGIARQFSMEPEQFMKHLADMDFSDPAVVNHFVKTARNFTKMDRITAVWYFALLSDPLTHLRNVIGNTAIVGTRIPEKAGAALVDPASRWFLREGGPRQRYIQEAGAEIKGLINSHDQGQRQAWGAIRDGWVPERTGDIEQFTREAWRGTGAGQVFNYPGRGLQAEDTYFRTLNEGMEKYALAERIPRAAGLKGQELIDETARLTKYPTDEMQKMMQEEGAYRVLQNKDKFAGWLNQGRDKFPMLRFLFPFTNTPINAAKYVAERSPLGFARILYDVAGSTPKVGELLKGKGGSLGYKGLQEAGSGALSDRVSRASIGSLTWGWLAWQAHEGNITGKPPETEAERNQWYREGKQPYSFRNPITGHFTSYLPLQPYAPLMQTAADSVRLWEKTDQKDPGNVAKLGAAMAVGIGGAMVNQQWTQGFADFLDAWGSGDENKLGTYVDRQGGNLVPGILRNAARITDDTLRDPEGIGESMMANTPGLSHLVPEKLDAFGRAMKRPQSGLMAGINPFAGTTPTDDPVELALEKLQKNEYQVEPGLVGKEMTVSVGPREVPTEMSREQQRSYQKKSGLLAYAHLSQLVGSDEWEAMPDAEKKKQVDKIFSDARKQVREGIASEDESRVKGARELIRQARLRANNAAAE